VLDRAQRRGCGDADGRIQEDVAEPDLRMVADLAVIPAGQSSGYVQTSPSSGGDRCCLRAHRVAGHSGRRPTDPSCAPARAEF
jgi:hypothetical protein